MVFVDTSQPGFTTCIACGVEVGGRRGKWGSRFQWITFWSPPRPVHHLLPLLPRTSLRFGCAEPAMLMASIENQRPVYDGTLQYFNNLARRCNNVKRTPRCMLACTWRLRKKTTRVWRLRTILSRRFIKRLTINWPPRVGRSIKSRRRFSSFFGGGSKFNYKNSIF